MKGIGNVKVYSTPACPYCGMAKDFLTDKEPDSRMMSCRAN